MKCIIIEDDDACRNALTQMVKQMEYLELEEAFSNPLQALPAIKKGNIDLVFLDIEMPEMSGIEMLKSTNMPPTILTTSHREHALEAFEYDIIDYLIKPIQLPRFIKAVEKAKVKNILFPLSNGTHSKDYFFIKKDSVFNKVPLKDILWIEALGDYLTVHTFEKKFIIHLTLKAIEKKLPTNKFIRVHRSFIVNMDNVGQVEDTTIYIHNTPIPIGALHKENFTKALNLL